MERFTTLRAIAAPLMRENIDTDIIIRIERLLGPDAVANLGPVCFESWRYLPDGSENPDFVLNREPYRRAEILLASHNFGCGSSREGAVTALMQMGIRCVVAPSFGDIFFNNCCQNGLLPVVMELPLIEAIVRDVELGPEQHQVSVDLEAMQVLAPDGTRTPFHIPALRRKAMLEGLDDLGLMLKRAPEIAAFQDADRRRRPWIHQPQESRP
jgi:3-isopropylmalate/(R)-2-methylmalate dehydratase small subunit